MSTYEALTLMLNFGLYTLTLISLIIVLYRIVTER